MAIAIPALILMLSLVIYKDKLGLAFDNEQPDYKDYKTRKAEKDAAEEASESEELPEIKSFKD